MSPRREFEVGFLFVFGEDEIGAEVGAAFRDKAVEQVGFAVVEKLLDFARGDFFSEQRFL